MRIVGCPREIPRTLSLAEKCFYITTTMWYIKSREKSLYGLISARNILNSGLFPLDWENLWCLLFGTPVTKINFSIENTFDKTTTMWYR